MSNRGFPSMTALLALLAMAGYQNRDKIAEMLRNASGGAAGGSPGAPGQLDRQAGQPDLLGSAHPPGTTPANSSGLGDAGLGGLLGSLGGLFGGLAGGGGAGGQSSGNVLQDGLGELLDRFRQTGHNEADSWVSSGPNQDIDDRNLEHALGPDVLETLSEKTGLSREELLARLSRSLPQAVDAYTPNGRLEA